MGYLDDEVKRLQGIISDIESRVKALENRQLGGGQKKTVEEIRMILIGPPGAGTSKIPLTLLSCGGRGIIVRAHTAQAREHKRPRSRRSSTAVIW
jgi:hypothetical protein